MAKQQFVLHPKEIAKMNNHLKDLSDIRDDLERAKLAGVPNVERIEEACQTCAEQIAKIKAQYAKGK